MWLGTQFNKKRGGMSRARKLRVAELNMGKRTRKYIAELWNCMESLDLDIVGLVETGVLAKDKEMLHIHLDPEHYQIYQIPATNEGSTKVQGGLALIVSKKNGVAVEKVEYDKKEGRWIRVLVALGGTELG